MKRSKARQPGFTLVEVVIAISILAVILGTAYSAITQIIGTKRLLDDKRDNTLVANSIVRRLGRELQLATGEYPIIFSSATTTPSSSLVFLGSGSSGGSHREYDGTLTFVAMEGGQYLPDGGIHTGLVQITYRLAEDPEQRGTGLYSLIREEIPYVSMPDTNDRRAWEEARKKSFDKRMVFPVAENVASFSLKYFDLSQNQWLNEWGINQRDIPAMIYYSITLVSPLGSKETYATTVPISSGR